MLRSRVPVLALGIVMGGLLTAPAVLASDGSPVIQGTSNFGSTETGVFTTNNGAVANGLDAQSLGNGGGDGVLGSATRSGWAGVHGFSFAGPGVFGEVQRTGNGVHGQSSGGNGVFGDIKDGGFGTGVEGDTVDAAGSGVFGLNNGGGVGVTGQSDNAGGTGVLGTSFAGNAVGVRANNTNPAGKALDVQGKAHFSRSGKVNVPAGARQVTVSGVALSAASFVLTTMQAHRPGVSVESAVPNVAGASFTIMLSGPVSTATPVGWFILN